MKKRGIFKLSLFFIFLTPAVCHGQYKTSGIKNSAVKVNTTSLTNLYKVTDSIYRSEQPDKKAFRELSLLGIKSVLNLRNSHADPKNLQGTAMQFFSVSMQAKHCTDTAIITALKILINAPKPILVHCRYGADRTGLVIAMYRIIIENWSKEQALDELQNGGFHFHKSYKNIPEFINTASLENIRAMVLSK